MKIIGIGQPGAGDDGVGPAIIAAMADDPPGELLTVRDPAAIIEQLDGPCVLVDAVVGAGPVGTVRSLNRSELAALPRPLSSHGIDVVQALGLAEALHGPLPRLWIIGVCILPPTVPSLTLSPPVAAAIPAAVELIREVVSDA